MLSPRPLATLHRNCEQAPLLTAGEGARRAARVKCNWPFNSPAKEWRLRPWQACACRTVWHSSRTLAPPM
eukprot:scaffold1987_cov377-Prasinococcus_capsulatus_cf.AAC.9